MNSLKSLVLFLFSLGMFINQAFAQVPSYVPSNGLVGWWPFTGNANDLSGNGSHGTVNGATLTTDRFGNANQAYSFDGLNDYISLATINQLGLSNSSFSISIWVRCSVFGQNNGEDYIIGTPMWGGGSDEGVKIQNNPQGNPYGVYSSSLGIGGQIYCASNNNFSLHSWESIVVRYNNLTGLFQMYINGNLMSSSTLIGSPLTNPYPVSVGAFVGPWISEFLSGKTDDIGIWNRALTQQEITNLYNANNGPQATISTANNSICAGQSAALTASIANAGTSCNTTGLPPSLNNGLVGYWPFCGNANDASGNANNGTVNGATLTADRFGVANSAYYFNGASRIDIGTLNNQIGNPNSSWSVNCWFKSLGSANGDMVLVSDYSSSSGGDQVVSTWLALWSYTFNNKVGSTIRNFPNGWDALSTNSYNDNQWHSLASVAETGSLSIYVDGVLITSVAYPANTNFQGSPFFRFGTILFNGQFDSYFQGQLDDIGIWNRALSAQEVSQLYNAGQPTYAWSNGATTPSITVTPAQTTTYTCTVTMNGATTTQSQTITVNALPNVSGGTNQTVCAGTSVTLSGSGASTYTWNNGVSNAVSFTPSSTQTYTVTGTAANGCTNTAQVTITVNALPSVSGGPNQTICAGTSVTLSGSGASTYIWNNGVINGVSFTPNNTQIYTVTGTDVNGCANTAQVTVTVNALPTVSAGLPLSICQGSNVVLFGSGAQTYVWNNGVQNAVPFVPIATQTYTVTGTDANGCTDTDQILVTVNSYPQVSAGQNQTVCAGDSVTLTASGAPFYSWSNGIVNGVTFVPVSTTTYSVIGNSNGCLDTAQVTVTVNSLPTVVAGQAQTVCAGASITLNGSGAQTYTWNNGVSNGVFFTPNNTQTYTVIGTDTNGCQGTDQVLVEVLSPTISEINEIACVAFTLNGQSYTQSGTYIQNLTNIAGCDSTLTLNLTINELPSIPVIQSSNENILSIDAQANVSYQWIFCESGLSINNASDTIYSPTVNGVYGIELTNGCGTVTSECVTINNMNVPELMNEILVYPNPSLGLVYIEGLTETSIPFKLQDITGRVVLEGIFNASSNVLDITRLSSGNYRILIPGYGIFSLVKQ